MLPKIFAMTVGRRTKRKNSTGPSIRSSPFLTRIRANFKRTGPALRSARRRTGVARRYRPCSRVFDGYGYREQSAMGSRNREPSLHERSRAAPAPGNCAGDGRDVRPRSARNSSCRDHINEGHAALAILERLRVLVDAGTKFQEALEQFERVLFLRRIRRCPPGRTCFPFSLFEKYFANFYNRFGADRDTLLQLGVNPSDPGAGFNMTVFALRMSKFCNAVSKKHAEVSRKMWANVASHKGKSAGETGIVANHKRRSFPHVDGSDLAAAAAGPLRGSQLGE